MKLLITIFIIFQGIISISQENYEPRILCEGSNPTFSPDGKFIAYEYKQRIWVYNLTTNEKKQVSSLTWDFRPRWSPTGEKIIFQSYGDSIDYNNKRRFAIWIVNKDGSEQHKFMEEHKDGDQSPYWSPNGDKIIWTRGKRLWIADTSGKNSKPLNFTPATYWEYIVDWSKDGNSIMFLRKDEYRNSPQYKLCLFNNSSKSLDIIYPRIYTEHAQFVEDDKGIYFIQKNNDNSNNTNNAFYLSKYFFSDKRIEENIYEIIIDNGNYLMNFDISMDEKFITYDDDGPKTTPRIYLMRIN